MQTFLYTHPLRRKYQTNNQTNTSNPNPHPRIAQSTPECTNIILAYITNTKSIITKVMIIPNTHARFAGSETLLETSSTSSSTVLTFFAKVSATSSPSCFTTLSILALMFSSTRTVLAAFNAGRICSTLANSIAWSLVISC